MKRVLGALGAVLLVVSLVAMPAQAAADPCSPITDELNVSDPFLGSGIEYDPATKTLTFITEDGQRLVGKNARKIGKRRVIVTSRAPDLSIDVRADLLRGQVFASAVERDVDPAAQPVHPERTADAEVPCRRPREAAADTRADEAPGQGDPQTERHTEEVASSVF
jgi:hypothetical protein